MTRSELIEDFIRTNPDKYVVAPTILPEWHPDFTKLEAFKSAHEVDGNCPHCEPDGSCSYK